VGFEQLHVPQKTIKQGKRACQILFKISTGALWVSASKLVCAKCGRLIQPTSIGVYTIDIQWLKALLLVNQTVRYRTEGCSQCYLSYGVDIALGIYFGELVLTSKPSAP